MNAPVRKPSYKTFVVERHVLASRSAVWQALVELLDAGMVDDEVLSFEPPWRRAGRLDVPPLLLAEHTVAIRDDGDECHLVWAYVAEPPAGDDPALDAALVQLRSTITAWADAVSSRGLLAAGGEAVLAHREGHEDQQQAEGPADGE